MDKKQGRIGAAVWIVAMSLVAVAGAARAECVPTPTLDCAQQWRRWEKSIKSFNEYLYVDSQKKLNPSRDLKLTATFTQVGVGKPITYTGRAFWYGIAEGDTPEGKAFRIRGAFPPGTTWRWTLTCTLRDHPRPDTPDCSGDSLLNTSGLIEVDPLPGGLLYSGGFLRATTGQAPSLVLNNSTSFFWLGDTFWNANLLVNDENQWTSLLDERKTPLPGLDKSQFTVIQMAFAPDGIHNDTTIQPFDRVTGCGDGVEGPGRCFRFNPDFWKALDQKVEEANKRDIVVVLASFIDPISDSGNAVPTNSQEATFFAEEVAGRLLGNFVIYSPGFDHKVREGQTIINETIIDTVGSGIKSADLFTQKGTKGSRSIHLLTNHTAGGAQPDDYLQLHKKTWLNFELFQSGTPGGSLSAELQGMTKRAVDLAAKLSTATPLKPAVNGESVYPGLPLSHESQARDNHTPYRARQTAYYSMLSGAQGYTMGTCGVFDWPPGFADCQGWTPSHPAVQLTVTSMKVMRSIFESVPWRKLKPAQSRIMNQPNSTPPDQKMVLGYDGSGAILAYVPHGKSSIQVSLRNTPLLPAWTAKWFDPRTGASQSAGQPVANPAGIFAFTKPGTDQANCERYDLSSAPVNCNDWVLRITKGAPASSAAFDVVVKSAAESGGNSMVVWQTGEEPNLNVLGRVFDSQGNVVRDVVVAIGKAASPGHPAVAALANGDFVVAWAGADSNHYGPWIRTQRYTRDGFTIGPPGFPVACSYVEGDFPQVASGGAAGGYALGWEMPDGNGIQVLRVDAAGSTSDARLAENTGSIAALESIDVSASSAVTVSYGLYADDGTLVGGDSPTVSLHPGCSVPALALADTFSTETNQPITIAYRELLENDAPALTFDQAGAKCVPTADGHGCTYTPPFGFTGNDTFTYAVHDVLGHPGSATVTIAVGPPLVANPDSFTMAGDTSLQLLSTQLLANDSEDAVFVDAQNAVNGVVSCTGSNPATCTFTPAFGFRGTASFQYRISSDGAPPFVTGTVTITVTEPSPLQITTRCTDGVCVFTANAPNAQAASNYVWRFGDAPGNPSFTSVYKVNHRFTASGTYTVSVIVTYNFGLPQQQGSVSVPITYATPADWDTALDGLVVVLDNFRLTMFGDGTRPALNWSPNPADCADPNDGCGSIFRDSDNGCDFQNCRMVGVYSHGGIFDATVRIKNGGVILKDYPFAIEAVNQTPVPHFTVSRPDPNVRRYVFTNVEHGDDGPFPLFFAWDFGDGATDTGQEDKPHLYSSLGTYTATLTVTDGEGLSGVFALPINVTNAPPVPRITVNCSGLDCELGGELSTDDGSKITTWSWDFGDGTSGSGARLIHHYVAGCYTVLLTVTDGDGASGTTTLKIVAGPPLVAANTKVVADAHVQSYRGSENGVAGWYTTNGNLNGILEPGETVVVEPTWPIAPSAQPIPVSATGVSPWGNLFGFRDFALSYDVSSGVSDCWTLGHCYAVFVLPQYAQTRPLHGDIQFNETNLLTGQPAPGNPVTIHVGKSFSDVTTSSWAYADIESVLHFGVDNGCGGTQFCPGAVVTRGEIARWLMKAEHGAAYQPPSCTASPYTDVPCSHPYAAWIAQLKAEGLTSGVGGGNYAPDQALTRAEAAVFVLRTKLGPAYVPPACSPDFGDVVCGGANPHFAAAWISDVKARGISQGCDRTAFCPGDAVDRAQAAALIAKTFGLRIDKVQCPIVVNGGLDVVSTHNDQPPIVSITFNPNPAVVGSPSTATMTIGDPPPVSTSIPLSIDSAAASVPASVAVPAYATSASFAVTPANITVRTTTHITATYLGEPKIVALDICTLPPSIGTNPTSRIINNGDSTTLSVVAAGGGGTLSYQWYQGNAPSTTTPVPGGTNSTLTISPTVTTSYWVLVSATCGSVASTTATVTVCNLPQITKQPPSLIIRSGASTTLTVTATGSDLSYQWFEGASGNTATPISGATTNSYTTPVLFASKLYWVRVRSTCNGTVDRNSTTATVTTVTQLTRTQSVSVKTDDIPSISATWPLPTQAGNVLVAVISASNITAIGPFMPPAGWVLAKDYEWNNIHTAIYYYPNCPAGRSTETFTVARFPDMTLFLAEYTWVTATPLDQTAFDGDNFAPAGGALRTGTTGTTAQASEVAVSALTTYATTSFTAPTNGFVELSDQSATFDPLTTAVHEKILTATGTTGHSATQTGTGQWVGVIATFKAAPPQPPPITSLTFSPSPASSGSTSTGTLTLGIAPPTATNVALSIDNPAAASIPASVAFATGQTTATFTVTPAAVSARTTTNITATYLTGTKTTQLDICPVAPTITAHPTSRTINAGQSTTLSVTATGAGTLTYQWYQGTSPSTANPVGTNSSSLTVTPAATASYWVAVSNGCGITASNTATVTVCTPPAIAVQPSSATTSAGQSVTLSVTASGSGPFSYQWYQGAAGVTTTPVGTNSSTFNTGPLFATTNYWVRVTSACNGGTVSSNTATVAVVSTITRVQAASGVANSQPSITVSWPHATTAGNLLVAVVSGSNVTAIGPFTPPAGWVLAKNYEWNNIHAAIYYYPNCPGGRTSETFTVARFPDLTLQLLEYSGIALSSPLDKTAFNGDNVVSGGTVSTGTTPATAQSKELIVSALCIQAQDSFASPTNSFITISNLNVFSTLTTATFERIVSAAGSYGHSATVGSSTQWVGVIATFKSADTTAANSSPTRTLVASAR
jgi:PKD repeat protein